LSDKFSQMREATYHVREVITDTPQVRLQGGQEGRGSGGHVYKCRRNVNSGQVRLEILLPDVMK